MMEKEDMFQTLKRLFLSHLFRLYILTHFVCLRQSLMTDNLTHACHPSCKYRAMAKTEYSHPLKRFNPSTFELEIALKSA